MYGFSGRLSILSNISLVLGNNSFSSVLLFLTEDSYHCSLPCVPVSVAKKWEKNKLRHPDEETRTDKWTDRLKEQKRASVSVSSVLFGWLVSWGAAAMVFSFLF